MTKEESMKKKAYLVVGLIAAIGVFGIVETSEAQPKESQRLRGLGGRVFSVLVTQVFGPPIVDDFQNCYVFDQDGTWFETEVSTEGFWTQDSVGARTTYRVDALSEAGPFFLPVEQVGQVTPAGGRGILQLVAARRGSCAGPRQ